MVVHVPEPAPAETAEADRLRAGSVGAAGITFFVVAAAAPLTCVIAITPLIIALGAGVSAPLIYLVIGAVLLLFSVGYVAMSRRIPSPGALYTYITHGLGPSAGVGAAFVSLLAYVASLITLGAFFGYALSGLMDTFFGWSAPWYACSVIAILLAMAVGHHDIAVGAKVLAVLLVAEVAILALLAVAVLLRGGAQGIDFSPLNPSNLFDSQGGLVAGVGVSLAFAYASYIGFEQTAIYAEEAKGPHSVKRATYAAVILTSLFYAVITWVIILAFGSEGVVGVATATPGTLVFDAAEGYLGSAALLVMQVLVVTSSLATILSFHNATSRYLYALGREGIIARAFGRSHSRTKSPHRASLLVGAIHAGILGFFAFVGVDPYLGVFTWGAAASAVGFIALQAVCSVAVFAYFRRHRDGAEGTWTALVSPVLAFLGLAGILSLILVNFSYFVGADVGPLGMLVPGAFALAAVFGVAYGLHLKRTKHEVWAGVGRGAI